MPQPSPSIPLSSPPLAAQLGELLAAGRIQAGDGVLYRYAHPDRVQRLIARIQARALADLGKRNDGRMDEWRDGEAGRGGRKDGMAEQWNDGKTSSTISPFHHSRASSSSSIALFHSSASAFTHAGLVLDAARTVEMTSPRCRAIGWEPRLAGIVELVVVRPANAVPAALLLAAQEGLAEARRGTGYPYRELLLYWLWSWGWRKLRGRTPFAMVFRDRTRNVCSGSLVQWWGQAGIDLGLSGSDAWPEAWYPARLLADSRFRLVAHLPAGEGQAVAAASPSLEGPGPGQWVLSASPDGFVGAPVSAGTTGTGSTPFLLSSVRACPSPSVSVPPPSGHRPATPPPSASWHSIGSGSGGDQARLGVDGHGHPGPLPSLSSSP